METGIDPNAPTRQLAVVSTVVWGLVGVVSLPMLLMSAMLFDAPGSEQNGYVWLTIGSLVALPVLCAVSVVGGWIATGATQGWTVERARARGRSQVILALLPLVGVAGVATGFVLIQALCHGTFNCR